MRADADNQLKERIRALARAHGFDSCHFSRPVVDAKFVARFREWLAGNYQGEMHWMAEDSRVARRMNPASMLEGVGTVLSLAMRYSPPAYSLAVAEAARSRGVIAAYAHGDDYHDVMKKRLKRLARALDETLGRHDQRVYVDTAPVLEHALAESSGLGWQGKHSLSIQRGTGSWFLLGEIFTTAGIEPDAPAPNHCGTCVACMDICPTRAIVAPYIVDARRCISYLTIEHRGVIPRELRPLIGNRVFGCDDCQLVCPWNRHAKRPEPDLLHPRGENVLPPLASLLALDEATFRQRFRKSPVRRTGRAGLVRNACIAAGNSGDLRLLEALAPLLEDDSALVRLHAAWAVGRLGRRAVEGMAEEAGEGNAADRALALLEACGKRETDDKALEEISLSIDYIRRI